MLIGRIFVAGMLAFGVVIGLVVAATPDWRDLPVPPFAWPLIAALVIDIALLPLIRQGRVEPLTMEQRAMGVIGAALIYTVILALVPT